MIDDVVRYAQSGGSGPRPQLLVMYSATDEFILAKRPLFLERCKRFKLASDGEYRDLSDSVQRLLDSGLLTEDDLQNTYITWSKRRAVRTLGVCYALYRVISISPALDSPDVPLECLDFVVYHEFLHLRVGVKIGGRNHNQAFRSMERMYPDYDRVVSELRKIKKRRPPVRLLSAFGHLDRNTGQRTCRIGPSSGLRMEEQEKRGFVFNTPQGDMELSIEEVERLAAEGDQDGLYALAMAYLFGWDVEEDAEKGYYYLEKAVGAGQTEAMALMVRLFMQGEYEGITSERAAQLSIKAAGDGIPEAQLYAGLAYMDGVSVEQDYKEAARYFRLAANQGSSDARASLAYLFQEGLGVEKDEHKAFMLYRTAARAGNVNAMFQLAVCYEFGTGTAVDLGQAAEWYRKGAEQGDAFAMERLGYLHSEGIGGGPDPAAAFEWFLKAAMEGVTTAMTMTGHCYLKGIGVEPSEEEAAKWLKMAADNGDEEAKAILDSLDAERLPKK